MTKLEVQKRVLQNGKHLDLDKFNWCEETKEDIVNIKYDKWR